MKNNKFAKISLLILSLALVIGAAFAVTAAAEDEAVTPEIISQNVAYEGDFALVYAVDATGITGAVTLNVYEEYPTDSSAPVWTGTDTEPEYVEGNLNATVYKFTTNGIAAADMCKQFYIQAVVNDTNAKSDVLRYSVAEYLYERLATPTTESNPTEKQRELYNAVIDFGDLAQEVVGGVADSADRIKNYQFVTVTDGKLDGYFTTGVYPVGSTLALTSDETAAISNTWTVTPYDADGVAGTSTTATSVTVTSAARLHIALGKSTVINYTAGYNNLDKIEEGAAFDQTYGSVTRGIDRFGTDSGTVGFVKYDGRGTVLYAENVLNRTNGIVLNYDVTAKKYDETTSKAFELSFDIKMATTGNTNDGIAIKFYNYSEAIQFNIKLKQYTEKTLNTDLVVMKTTNEGTDDTSEQATFTGVDPSDWFHVKIVVYEDEQDYAYVYINGDYSNYLKVSQYTAGDVSYSAYFAAKIFGVYSSATAANSDSVWLDNIFLGFTEEENPHTAQ